jgi:hypothetical protein
VIVLDTTVLAYALGVEHPLRTPSCWLLTAHQDGRIDATTTVEVLQEFLHLLSRRRTRQDAAERTREFAEAFDLLVTTPVTCCGGPTCSPARPRPPVWGPSTPCSRRSP